MKTRRLYIEVWSDSEEDLKAFEKFVKSSISRFKKRDLFIASSHTERSAHLSENLGSARDRTDRSIDALDRLLRGGGGL